MTRGIHQYCRYVTASSSSSSTLCGTAFHAEGRDAFPARQFPLVRALRLCVANVWNTARSSPSCPPTALESVSDFFIAVLPTTITADQPIATAATH